MHLRHHFVVFKLKESLILYLHHSQIKNYFGAYYRQVTFISVQEKSYLDKLTILLLTMQQRVWRIVLYSGGQSHYYASTRLFGSGWNRWYLFNYIAWSNDTATKFKLYTFHKEMMYLILPVGHSSSSNCRKKGSSGFSNSNSGFQKNCAFVYS